MWIEDDSHRLIREAKIKAYGKCDKHKDHFSWGDFISGISSAVPIMLIPLFLVMTHMTNEINEMKAHPEIQYIPTPQNGVSYMDFSCIDLNGKTFGGSTMDKTLNVVNMKACTIEVQ